MWKKLSYFGAAAAKSPPSAALMAAVCSSKYSRLMRKNSVFDQIDGRCFDWQIVVFLGLFQMLRIESANEKVSTECMPVVGLTRLAVLNESIELTRLVLKEVDDVDNEGAIAAAVETIDEDELTLDEGLINWAQLLDGV